MTAGAVRLAPRTEAWFTGTAAGNLSHRRPHLPGELHRRRLAVASVLDLPFQRIHLMRQVHGAEVAVVDDDTPEGAELPGVDALVTTRPDRPLGVLTADCVPLLVGSDGGPVAAIHAGRRGLAAGVIEAALSVLAGLGAPAPTLRVAVGPAIGGCCYEVPEDLRRRVAAHHPVAAATTTWGSPALDLPAAASAVLSAAGATVVADWPGCTHCDAGSRWFSHRRDPAAGRQLAVVVRRASAAGSVAA